MKKLFFLFLAFCTLSVYSQSKLNPQETKDLLMKTNYMYCQLLEDIIDCMFVFDQAKYDKALENLKTVSKNYDSIEKNGTLSGSAAMNSLQRSRFDMNKWSVLTLRFDTEEFKNGKRNKTVKYHSEKRKIPKKLAKQFDNIVDIKDKVCVSNMY